MPYYFTAKSLELYRTRISAFEQELARLQGQISEVTTSGGGFHDNASLDHLQHDIRLAESRLAQERKPLSDIRVITYPQTVDSIVLGSIVAFTRDNIKDTLEIVAYGDEDFENSKILYCSPIAIVLTNHKKGDVFSATVTNKVSRFHILDVLPLRLAN